ncbi:MAG: TrkH family potassium uptake protein [Muribaculaceae bacterium]|nr:TrkH family potassium uptake protein [Muribaculaceae bacterium]
MSIFNQATRHLVNARMLLRIMGWLLIIEAVFLVFPTLTCLLYGEDDWLPFACTSVLTVLVGLILAMRSRPTSPHMGKRDGYLLTAMVWVVFSFFGLIPFLFCSQPMSYSDAFFEAMSGFTTTGASVITASDHIGHGVHLWRAMMQWIGGMGIILFTLAVIPMLNHSGGMQMFNAEVTGITHDKISPRISQTAKNLWMIYTGLTVLLIALLWAGPMDLFDSICHAFGAISTGGYSSHPDGITAWSGSVYIKLVLIVFMFLGGVNFGLIYKSLRGNFAALRTNDVFKTYVATIALMVLLFAVSILWNGKAAGWQSVTIDPLFQVVSTITSTGFTVSNFEEWGPFVLSLTFVMMFFGACAGSTSGGAKIDRILYLFKNADNELYRCIYPRSILSVKVNGRVVNPELVNKVIAFLCIYMLLVVGGGMALTACGVPLVDSFFSSFSCISNTGLGAGITGYGNSYDILPDAAKWILSLLMLTGRLEIFTILVLLTPAFWRR